ncbi:MAG: class I SAM-dependent methyltransferase [Nanoarchaeota archaeon]
MKREINRKNYTENRDKYILKICKNKKVLHIGACDAPYTKIKEKQKSLLYLKISKVCKEQLGIDLDKKSIEYLNNKKLKNSKIKYVNMNNLEKINFKPEVIVFGETIEHLMNLQTALENIKKIMTEDTLLLVSTPNSNFIFRILEGIRGKVTEHEDHNVLFNYKTLEQLFRKTKFKVLDKKFTFLDNNDSSTLSIFRMFLAKSISKLFPIYAGTLLFIVKK